MTTTSPALPAPVTSSASLTTAGSRLVGLRRRIPTVVLFAAVSFSGWTVDYVLVLIGGAQARQERPRALAPGQEGGGRVEELPPGVAQVGGALAPGREDAVQAGVDAGLDQCGGGAERGHGGRVSAPRLPAVRASGRRDGNKGYNPTVVCCVGGDALPARAPPDTPAP